ncbi:MAG: hypothetical protein ABMB14_06280 [Myxococcota bacterium]
MRAEAITAPIRVLGGAVQGGAVELALAARQGSRVPTGGAPLPAVDLLVETALRTPEPRTPLGRPTFRWDPVPDAFAYRIEVSTNRAFTGLVYAETVAEPEHRPAMLLLPSTATGIAWWRVAPVDRFGFLGVPSDPWPFEIPGAIGP